MSTLIPAVPGPIGHDVSCPAGVTSAPSTAGCGQPR